MKSRNFTLLLLFIITICHAQIPTAGTLDPNFGNSGSAFPPSQKNLIPYSVNVQSKTGEIITAGNYVNSSGKTVGFIGRYDFNGTPKTNFGTNGVVEIPSFPSLYKAYFESSEPNSAIYIRGSYNNGTVTTYIFSKYLSDGTLDTSYGTNGLIVGLRGQVHENYVYSLVLNTVTQHQSFNRYHLSDGSLDTSFNNGDLPFLNSEVTFYADQYETINIQADGKILLCGRDKINKRGVIARFDSTGNIDTSFGVNGYYYTNPSEGATDLFYTKTQSDGKIVFLNSVYLEKTPSTVFGRLNSNGTLDTTYGTSGYFNHTFNFSGTYIDDVKIQSDDKIVFCGSMVTNSNGRSVLFTAMISNTGTLDFWKNDLESAYSENWSLALIKDSYALSFGHYTADNFLKTFPVIQKFYLKVPAISINGSSLPNGTTDIALSTSDGILFSKENVALSSGNIKFRLDNSDNLYWGTTASNPFPAGTSTLGAQEITVNSSGTYKVSFNIKTGEYSFINTSLGLKDNNLLKNKFIFFPNPAKEKIVFNENIKSINVYSSDGKLINVSLIGNEINISSLSKGVYFFQAITENETIIGNKFIKE